MKLIKALLPSMVTGEWNKPTYWEALEMSKTKDRIQQWGFPAGNRGAADWQNCGTPTTAQVCSMLFCISNRVLKSNGINCARQFMDLGSHKNVTVLFQGYDAGEELECQNATCMLKCPLGLRLNSICVTY